ncbi:MAG TPA: hypothetical protein VD766_05715 [Solirubrobacterales bacterium]|nr:hypothetical protein [Solirubrobacterales bacterium]
MSTLSQIPRYLAGVLGRVQDRLTYANVTATLALAVAVGGGIALAGGGNDDPSDPHPVVARQAGVTLEAGQSKKLLKLPKLVTLTAQCDGPNDGNVVYESIAKSRLRVAGVAANHSSVDPLSYSFAVQPGETGDFDGPGSLRSYQVSIFHSNAGKVTPQADLTVDISGCEIRARALTVND